MRFAFRLIALACLLLALLAAGGHNQAIAADYLVTPASAVFGG